MMFCFQGPWQSRILKESGALALCQSYWITTFACHYGQRCIVSELHWLLLKNGPIGVKYTPKEWLVDKCSDSPTTIKAFVSHRTYLPTCKGCELDGGMRTFTATNKNCTAHWKGLEVREFHFQDQMLKPNLTNSNVVLHGRLYKQEQHIPEQFGEFSAHLSRFHSKDCFPFHIV